VTELNVAKSEEDRIVALIKIILKFMKQNGCIQTTCTADYEHDK
jgi:hypothetical protein